MVDPHALDKVIEAADLDPTDFVIEVGTGTGLLTESLAKKVARVVTVEIDKKIQEIAQEQLKGHGNITWVLGDILEQSQKKLMSNASRGGRVKVVSNPPYSISSPLLDYFIGWDPKPELLVLTLQKEVIDRILGNPGTDAYGSLSLFAQYYFDAEKVGEISAGAFFPAPEVDSAILLLRPKRRVETDSGTEKMFFKIVRAVFQQRRKTFWNVLRKAFPDFSQEQLRKILEEGGVAPSVRGETLPLETYLHLAGILKKI